MTSYPTTLVPLYPTPPFESIDDLIMYLWDRHIELEINLGSNKVSTTQNLDLLAAVIDYWEEKLTEITQYEIQQRRSNSCKNSR